MLLVMIFISVENVKGQLGEVRIYMKKNSRIITAKLTFGVTVLWHC